jgi:hypothetical protein
LSSILKTAEMKMKFFMALGVGLAMAAALVAIAQAATPPTNEHSASNILPGCRFLVAPKPATITSDVSGWSVGLCSGTIEGILAVAVQQQLSIAAQNGSAKGALFCTPPAATTDEAIRIVVRYLDDHSNLKQENFGAVALEALEKAWPCN